MSELTKERLDELERLRARMTPGTWELWDGCSWRRFGIVETNKTVIEPTTCHHDNHPDLHARYEDMRGIVAMVNEYDALLSAARKLAEVREWAESRLEDSQHSEGFRKAAFVVLQIIDQEPTP